MKKTSFVLLFFFAAGMITSVSASEEVMAVSAISSADVAVAMPAPDFDRNECDLSDGFVDSLLAPVLTEMNLTDYAFKNVSRTSCYSYSDYSNIHVTVDLKRSETDYVTKSLSMSFSASTEYDYSVLFTVLEDEKLGWSLKRKYVEFVENGTDDEYFVRISPEWEEEYDCDTLESYYASLSGEKYWESNRGYCSVVVKTKTSELKSLVSESVGYINYFTESLRYNFEGYSEGVFDLESLSKSLGCSLNSNDYYYPESDLACYGIYKDKTRIHFSAHTNIGDGYAYLNAYGYEGDKAVLSVSAYGEGITSDAVLGFVRRITSQYLGTTYSLTLDENDREVFTREGGNYKSFTGKARISDFSVDVSGLELEEYNNNKYYSGTNVSASVSEPFIQVYVPETLEDAQVVGSDEKASLMPYYWGRSFIITANKVFSSVNLEENDVALAEEKIKAFVSPYVETGDWFLDMSVGGGWFYPMPLGARSETLDSSGGGEMAVGSFGVASPNVMSDSAEVSVERSVQNTGVSDSFASEFPEFSELDEEVNKPSVIESIINFVKSFFGR